jgi:hypothetical protein
MALKPWTLAAVAVAAFFFVIAISNAVYEMTSPSWLSWHVVLRKAYSIVAFTIVGYLFRRALAENGKAAALGTLVGGVALYSAGIEVAQFLCGSKEGLGWNAFDTVCGGVGGGLAALVPARRPGSVGTLRARRGSDPLE